MRASICRRCKSQGVICSVTYEHHGRLVMLECEKCMHSWYVVVPGKLNINEFIYGNDNKMHKKRN